MTASIKISCLLILLLCSGVTSAQDRSGDEEFYFNIPRLSAHKALTRFARQAGITLLFPYNDVKKIKTRPLHGRFSIRYGLQLMLSGTDIVVSTGVTSEAESEDLNGLSHDIDSGLPVPDVLTLTMAVATSDPQVVQEEPDQVPIEEVLVLGSRSAKARTVANSPVPIDFIAGDEFALLGNGADITDNLKALIPSYTASPATGDGSAFIRPTSLRGMSPDQTLVLVNGKRRHRSSLVQFFAPAAGNGSHAVDVGMIPAIALKNVQVLRDGAAAQYGSDAIAGVMDFELRDENDGGEVEASFGQFYEGENSTRVAANVGFRLGGNGFVNLSAEYVDNDALSRGLIRPDAQALIDAGVPGVGADSPFGDAPFTQSWGRPETSASRFFINSGWAFDGGTELYLFGNYAQTTGRYRFFYRNPSHPSISALGLQSQFPTGYTPFLDGDQTDFSLVAGVRGVFDNGISYDLSIANGRNELDYFLNNSLNPSLAIPAGGSVVRDFDVGGYMQDEINLNADFSMKVSEQLSVSYGAEFREETFNVLIGDSNSRVGEGPSGFNSPTPENADAFTRENIAAYIDVEHDITDHWLMQYALRYEDFSDFGSTINGKVASRYMLSDAVTLRGTVSTGFHAPTPGQANISSIITTFDGQTGQQVQEGLVQSNSQAAKDAGGTDLKEEESVNISVGFTASVSDVWDMTLDFHKVKVDDRIYLTGDIPIPGLDGRTLSFFTNALDLEHQGFDLMLNGSVFWSRDISTDITFAYAYSKIDVVRQSPVGGINPVNGETIEDIENNYPQDRFTFSSNTFLSENVNFSMRATYYGSHFDERGTINGAPGNRSAEIDPIIYYDAEVGWQFNDDLKLVFGASNIFDSFVDEIEDDGVFANRQSVGLQYPRRTAANYEGGSWYLKGIYSF